MSARYWLLDRARVTGPFDSYKAAQRPSVDQAMRNAEPVTPLPILLELSSITDLNGGAEFHRLLRDDPVLNAVFQLGYSEGRRRGRNGG